ncbi:MAG: DUF4386 domain-containing protein [Candidatus Cybelea sp.]
MGTSAMMKRIAEASKPPRGRITGAVYLLYFLTAIFAQFLVGRTLVIYSDTANLIATACYVAVVLLFYDLFRPVSRSLSLCAALFGLAGCIITTLGVFHLAPSHVSPILFFGPYCLMIGYLILRSTFLPRTLGVLMMLAGFGWLAFLLPLLANHLSTYIKVLGILAEGSLMLWLLVFGVNVQRWKEQSSVAGV